MVPSCRFTGPIRQYEVGLFAGIRIVRTPGHLCIAGIASHQEFNDGKSSPYAMLGFKLDLVVLTKWLCLKHAYLRRVRP